MFFTTSSARGEGPIGASVHAEDGAIILTADLVSWGGFTDCNSAYLGFGRLSLDSLTHLQGTDLTRSPEVHLQIHHRSHMERILIPHAFRSSHRRPLFQRSPYPTPHMLKLLQHAVSHSSHEIQVHVSSRHSSKRQLFQGGVNPGGIHLQ